MKASLVSHVRRWLGIAGLCVALSGCAVMQNVFKAAPNQLAVEQTGIPITFNWAAGKFGERIEPHSAMLIPIRFENVPRTLYMQFDLGAQSSVFYRTKLDSLRDKVGGFDVTREGETDFLGATQFTIGDMRVKANRVRVMTLNSARPIAWESNDSIELIGTIGADLIDGRVAVIDYPKRTLTLHDQLPPTIANAASWGNMRFVQRRIFLDAMIAGQSRDIIFDTGSSAFALLTDEGTWRKIAKPDASVERFDVKSWNNTMKANLTATDASAQVGGATLPIKQVTYVDDVGLMIRLTMRAMGVGGMSGNKLFIDHTIVLDTKNNKFGVIGRAS
jgi:hypothetical protein